MTYHTGHRKSSPAQRLRVCKAAVMLAVLMLAWLAAWGQARAQSLPVAGSGEDMWVVLPEADQRLTVLHRKAIDAPGHFWRVVTLPGVLETGGTAAGQGQLWLIYDNLIVQTMQVVPDPYLPQSRYNQAQFQRQLPEGVTIRSLAAGAQLLWALVDVSNAHTLAQLDTPPATQPAAVATTQTQPATQPTSQQQEEIKLDPPVARLIKLERGRWSSASLPDDWNPAHRAWLLMSDPDQPQPMLIVERVSGAAGQLRVHRQTDGKWTHRDHQASTAGELAFASVQQQLVMARRGADELTMRVTLSLLRPERDAAVELGSLSLDLPADTPWGIASNGLLATLVAREGQDLPVAASMDLHGQVVREPASVKIESPPAFVQDPGQMLLVAVVAISIFLMFVIWRRDPSQVEITLPGNLVLADFGRRLAAGAIDLAPCLLAGMLIAGESLMEMLRHWPGRTGSWSAMLPGLIAIGLFVLHTGISELFTGRTLGKAMLGLQVVSTDGRPPNIWQVLARNFLKSFDLIACYILPILALVGKHHQRLGDLVGRTLVVMPTAPKPGDEDDAPPRPE